MIGDFSIPYSADDDNFSGVLFQQGRVFLDRDGNAQTRIGTEWQDMAARDVIGAGVAAVPADAADSLAVETAALAAGTVTLTVHPGRAWADGLLVRLAGTPPITRIATYFQPPVQSPAATAATIANGVRDAVVLEVWREAVNAFQLPAQLVEPALGGPDTTERLHTAMAFRLFRLAAGETCENIADQLADDPSQKGTLTATLQPTAVIGGDCPVQEGGGYTGFEHNCFRIEIAAVDHPVNAPAMFKWSRFNGGLVGRGVFDAAALRVAITANLQAITSSGLSDFYLETREWDAALGRWRVTYGAAVTLNNDELVLPATPTFGAVPSAVDALGHPNHVFFRLWDGIRKVADFPLSATPTTLDSALGIFLQFAAEAPGKYIPEDYWSFSVRADGIGNPETLVDTAPPEGIRYHRVPLAELEWDGTSNLSAAGGTIDDCRRHFPPLTRITTCCTFRVGDGVHSHGDFTSIQAAIDHLPAEGGEVCVLPGTYAENVVIRDRVNVSLHGCGPRSRIESGAPTGEFFSAGPVIHVVNSRFIEIRDLLVVADDTGIGILVDGGTSQEHRRGRVIDITLRDLYVIAATRSAIEVRDAMLVTIERCNVWMKDMRSMWPGIFFIGVDGLIERNTIRVISPRQLIEPTSVPQPSTAGLGGLQLGGTSARVRVIDNLIQGGMGNGITLGSVVLVGPDGGELDDPVGWVVDADDPCNPCLPGDSGVPPPGDGGRPHPRPAGPLYDIRIERNRIVDMGLNGIGVIGFFDLSRVDELISVERLTILGNHIHRCLHRSLAAVPSGMIDSMGYGGIALADVTELVVHDNVIENNGQSHLDPVCGVFVLLGEGVDICRNRILNNGPKTEEPAASVRNGRRGGINIVYCIAPTVAVTIARNPAPDQNGVPALRVHDNIVSVPLGRALDAIGLGPIAVEGNQLTSRGVVPRAGGTTFVAAAVRLLNLGVSNEFYRQMLLFAAIRGAALSSGALLASSDDVVALPQPGLDVIGPGRYLGNGNVLFNDNQCVLDLVETGASLAWSSILILSLDDVSFDANQCDCSLRDDMVMAQAILFGFAVRATGCRFKEGVNNALYSAVTLGAMNTTAHNQATHCLLIRGLSLPGLVVDAPNTILLSALIPRYCQQLRGLLPAFGAKTAHI